MSSKFRSRGIATGRQELDEKSEAIE
jgi:hypothetical protein